MTGAPDDRPYFGRARTVAGIALIGLVIVLTIIDAASTDFDFDSIQLGLLLGTALLFLGVEAGRKLLGQPMEPGLMVVLWGGGTVLAYGRVMWHEYAAFRRHRDRRGRRDLLTAVAMFLVAVCTALAIAGNLVGGDANLRHVLTAVALGAFLGAGIVMATDRSEER